MAVKYAEVIFETGAKSVLSYGDEAEIQSFVKEHTKRAKAGEMGGPLGHPAERISKVLLYDSHPGDYASDGNVDVKAIQSLISGLKQGDNVNVDNLIVALRGEVSAVNIGEVAAHDTLYKMPHVGELALGADDGAVA